MDTNEIISSGLLEMYVLGVASPEEVTNVVAWRAEFPEVAEALAEIELAMESYAQAHASQPNPALKDKILQTINTSHNFVAASRDGQFSDTAKVVSMNRWRMAAAAAIILLVGSGIMNVVYFNKYSDARSKYIAGQTELAQLNNKVGQIEGTVSDMSRDMNIVRSKYSEPVALHGLQAAPDAGAKIFWMKNTGEVYVDPGNLPMAPHGHQYQLWAIVDGKPVDGGLIDSKDGKKYSIQKMKTFGKAQAFAITLETAGGNPVPKGTMYVMGEI